MVKKSIYERMFTNKTSYQVAELVLRDLEGYKDRHGVRSLNTDTLANAIDARETRLYKALSVATDMLAPFEPKDSRAVSDEFVALAAIVCKVDDQKVWDVIDTAYKRLKITDE
jgi:hypothetical protein